MKPIQKLSLLLLLFGLLARCNKEEIPSRAYPRLMTLPVMNVGTNGATFRAEFTNRGDVEILKYGFVWAASSRREDPDLSSEDKIIYTGNISSQHFSSQVTTGLRVGTVYEVRAFVETEEHTVYGQVVTFQSLGSEGPSIVKISPSSATIADTISIHGRNFVALTTANKVFFGIYEAKVISATDSLIKVLVPDILTKELKVSLTIAGTTFTLEEPFIATTPVIHDFFPKTLASGDTLTLIGDHFSYQLGSNLLEVGGKSSKVISSSKKRIEAIVPSGLDPENDLEITIANQKSEPVGKLNFLYPVFTAISPKEVTFGEEVTIAGNNLGYNAETDVIKVGDATAEVVTATKTSVTFLVPENLQIAENQVSYRSLFDNYMLDIIRIKPPVIHSTDGATLTSYNGDKTFRLIGENFNPKASKNRVLVGTISTPIISATNNELVFRMPEYVIPDRAMSYSAKLDVQVKVLDQQTILPESFTIDYQSLWTTAMTDFPGEPRVYGIAFSVGNKGYIGLGQGSLNSGVQKNDFWEYDATTETWTRLDDFPGIARRQSATFIIGKKCYLVGGYTGPTSASGNALREVWEFDTETHAWQQKKDFPDEPRWGSFGFSLADSGYIGAGLYRAASQTNNFKLDFWKYDPQSDTWERLNDILPKMWELPFQEEIFAIAGKESAYILALHPYSTNPRSSLWKYNPIQDSWSDVNAPNMNLNFDSPTGFVLNHKLYLASRNGFYEYTPATNGGKVIPFPRSDQRDHPSLFAIGDFGYMLFGRIGSNQNTVLKFDPSKSW